MKKTIYYLLILMALVLIANFYFRVNSSNALVVKVVDGDTIEILGGQKIRLIGIDAPEQGDCYFEESKEELENLLSGRMVRLIYDVDREDRYGRSLAYVYLGEIFVNKDLVERGYAFSKAYPPNTSLQNILDDAQKQSIAKTAGLWSKCTQ
jgi:micrococcal nuclease